jgi:hypothetical protein
MTNFSFTLAIENPVNLANGARTLLPKHAQNFQLGFGWFRQVFTLHL